MPILPPSRVTSAILNPSPSFPIKFSDGIFISAQHYLGLDSLLENIRSAIEETYLTTELFIPYKNGKHISSVQEGVEVLSKISHDKGMHLK